MQLGSLLWFSSAGRSSGLREGACLLPGATRARPAGASQHDRGL